MDPFSAAASALGVADVCFRLGRSIATHVKKFARLDEYLHKLQADVDSLAKVCTAIKEAYDTASQFQAPPTPPQSPPLESPVSPNLPAGFERAATLVPDEASLEASDSTAVNTVPVGVPPAVANLNGMIKKDLNHCRQLVEEMEGLIEGIVEVKSADEVPESEKGKHNKKNMYSRAKRTLVKIHDKKTKHSKFIDVEDVIEGKRAEINVCKQEMTIMLQVINVVYAASAGDRTTASIKEVSANIEDFKQHISEQIAQIKEIPQDYDSHSPWDYHYAQKQQRQRLDYLATVHSSLELGLETMRKEPRESFFDIPQDVSQHYTGRKQLLLDLERDLLPPHSYSHSHAHDQRVFVIHGLGGSGKTQFCCKFAHDVRHKIWGVLWVDASTVKRLQRSLVDLYVKYGGGSRDHSDVDQALSWLTNLDHAWLLIIDNADQPNLPIARYIPKSSRGCVLITTKSKTHTSLGTVGQGFYSFSGLEKNEATDLLLKTSLNKDQNWSDFRDLAADIAAKVGYLALAIVHAGTAIQQELCSFHKYIEYFETACKQIRDQPRSLHRLEDRRAVDSETGSDDSDYDGDVDTERDMPIFATWETCYRRLATKVAKREQSAYDAMQLLEIFAFLDRRRFSKEMLRRAITSAAAEKKADEASAHEERQSTKTGLGAWLKHLGGSMAMAFLAHIRQGGAKLLPLLVSDLRRYSKNASALDHRINLAFWELSQMALIGKNNTEDTYFMHPVVHTWARERLSLSHQALVVEMASSLLAASVLLPPNDSRPEDSAYHISLLPHVEYVAKSKALIEKRILNERERRERRGAAVFDTVYRLAATPDIDAVRMHAKFGLVYAKSGLLDKACDRLHAVQTSVYKYRGRESKEARRIDAVLSDIYFAQSQGPKARNLLQDLLRRCEASLGAHHADTYRVMGKLGRALWLMGFFTDAYKVQSAAVKGLEETLGRDAPDTLQVVDQLGSTVTKFWKPADLVRAYGLHKRVVDALSRNKDYGPNHELVLFATENMCRAAVLIKHSSAPSSIAGSDDEDEPPSPLDPFASADLGLGSFNPKEGSSETISAVHDAGKVKPEPPANVVPLMERVLRVREKALGKKHPYTLLSMVNYAITRTAVGDFAVAEKTLRDGLAIAYTILPSKHIGILFGRQTLACVLREQGKYPEAGRILQQVSQYQEEMEASRERFHPDRLATLIELAHCYHLAGDVDRSLRCIVQALDGFGTITDESHPIMIQTRETHEQLKLVKKSRAAGEEAPAVRFPRYLYES